MQEATQGKLIFGFSSAVFAYLTLWLFLTVSLQEYFRYEIFTTCCNILVRQRCQP